MLRGILPAAHGAVIFLGGEVATLHMNGMRLSVATETKQVDAGWMPRDFSNSAGFAPVTQALEEGRLTQVV